MLNCEIAYGHDHSQFNLAFGAKAWAAMNMEANSFAILPKYPWDKSGWRTISG